MENDDFVPGFDEPSGSVTFDFDSSIFEALAKESKSKATHYWLASDIAPLLGYKDSNSLSGAINKAQQASLSLGVPVDENFRRIPDSNDWALTRFGCYLVAMNGKVTKPEIAAAQAYFAAMAEGFRQYVEQAENMDRLLLRDEISEQETTLAATASQAGVERYAFFQNEGYRGLYNLTINQLRAKKGVSSSRSPLDFMGRTELAANLFRITQTEEKIKKERLRGQRDLESAAHEVGRKVRNTMRDLSGTKPEDLPVAEDISKVKTKLKKTNRKMAQPALKPNND